VPRGSVAGCRNSECPYLAASVEKVLLADEQNFLGPLMRFARGDVRDRTTSLHIKTTTDLRIGPTELCSSRDSESTFARFSESFDFRLLQQYLHLVDVGISSNFRFAPGAVIERLISFSLIPYQSKNWLNLPFVYQLRQGARPLRTGSSPSYRPPQSSPTAF